MKYIIYLAIMMVVGSSTTTALASSTPEKTIKDYMTQHMLIDKQMHRDISLSRDYKQYTPLHKYFSDKPFKLHNYDKSKYCINSYDYDDYIVGEYNSKSQLINVTIYDHKYHNKSILTFKLTKDNGMYKIVPGMIPTLKKLSEGNTYFNPWHGDRKKVLYDYAGEKTEHPPKVIGLPKPLGLDFGKTSDDDALAILIKLGGKLDKSGYRIIKGRRWNKEVSNPDVKGMYFSGVENIETVELWFYKNKLGKIVFDLSGSIDKHLDAFRTKYGIEDTIYAVTGGYGWEWNGVNLKITPIGNNTTASYDNLGFEMDRSDEQLIDDLNKKEAIKPSAL